MFGFYYVLVHPGSSNLEVHDTGDLKACIVLNLHPLDIPSSKKATEYCNNLLIDILTHNPQQIVKIQGPHHKRLVDQSETIISKESDEC